MKANKCVVCQQAKGKRICLINKKELICTKCCAAIRHSECESCYYYSQAGKYKSQKHSTFIARIDPDVDEQIERATLLLENNRIAEGEKIISSLLRENPDLHSVQFAMGVVCLTKKDYAAAIAYFDEAIRIFPFFIEAWFNKGFTLQQRLDISDAVRAFEKVIEIGNTSDSTVKLAVSAIKTLETIIQKNKSLTLKVYCESEDLFTRAFAAMQKEQWRQALAGFKKALTLDPNSPPIFGNIGVCYGKLGDKKSALAAFDAALEIDPSYEFAKHNRATFASLSIEDGMVLEMRSNSYKEVVAAAKRKE